jgi:hypothetical protein
LYERNGHGCLDDGNIVFMNPILDIEEFTTGDEWFLLVIIIGLL